MTTSNGYLNFKLYLLLSSNWRHLVYNPYNKTFMEFNKTCNSIQKLYLTIWTWYLGRCYRGQWWSWTWVLWITRLIRVQHMYDCKKSEKNVTGIIKYKSLKLKKGYKNKIYCSWLCWMSKSILFQQNIKVTVRFGCFNFS